MLNHHLTEDELQRIADKMVLIGANLHLAECTVCQGRLREYEAIFRQIDGDGPVELSADFEKHVLKRIKRIDLMNQIAKVLLYGIGMVSGLMICAYFIDIESVLSSFLRIEVLAVIKEYADLSFLKTVNYSLILMGGLLFLSLFMLDYALQYSRRRLRSM